MAGLRKGAVFTLDLLFGIIVFFLVVGSTLLYISRYSDPGMTDHNMMQVGSDIVSVLDMQGSFEGLDLARIESQMYSMLPSHYDMLLHISGTFTEHNGSIQVGGQLPFDEDVIAGERVAVTSTDYLHLRYFVWSK